MSEVTDNSSQKKLITVFLASTMRPSFILDDIESLQKRHRVDVFIGHGIGSLLRFVTGAARADVSISWFGSVYTWFMVLGARLFRKKTIVILGGVDTAREVELGYGIWRSRWKSALLRRALRKTDRILAVDASLRGMLESSSGESWERVEVVPTGYDAGFWTPGEGVQRDGTILCVAMCNSITTMRRKGIDLLLYAAEHAPELQFVIVGVNPDVTTEFLNGRSFPNIRFIPFVPRSELLSFYRSAKVYCQPSRYEGLPNALCEAMLCGCVPVGSDVAGIPNGIGDTGFVVPRDAADQLVDALRQAMMTDEGAGLRSRERIATLFTKQRREEHLNAIINELCLPTVKTERRR